jgi:glycoside/pentoside/hexuronide:cation symporter, GPH family
MGKMTESDVSIQNPLGGKLSFGTKLGFGIGDLGGNLFFTAMGFWSLNYLTDTVGIPAVAAGIAIMVAKIWDAVIDPFIGYMSDRTRSPWGRRRPYLLFGALPLFLAMWYFFSAPHFNTTAGGAFWAALMLCLLNTAYSLVNIPYGALTPELTKDFKERTSLNGFRFSSAVIGTILGAAIVLPIVSLAGGDKHRGFSYVGFIFGLIMAATILITFFSVREPDHAHVTISKEKFFATYLAVFKDWTYVRLLLVYACNLTGLTFVQTILVYYFKYLYQNEGMTTIAMIMLLVTAMVCIPISVLVAKKIGKKRTYQLALGILVVSCMTIFFLGHVLGMTFTLAVMLFAGIGIGFGYVPPFAMLPDVVEVDAIRSKTRKEGSYYGMWTFTAQLGVALATALAGTFLGWSGFVADAVQNPATLLTIRLIIGPIPSVIFIAGILLINRYPLDEKTYDAILLHENSKADG